jgi:hypothetical protein
MLFTSARAIFEAASRLFKNWRTMALLAIVYGVFLGSVYIFVTTREATVVQLIVSLLLAVAAPIVFFVLQAASAGYAVSPGAGFLLKKSLRSFWKLLVVSLPVVALTLMALYLLGKAQIHLVTGAAQATLAQTSAATGGRQPVQWGLTAVLATRYLLLGAFVPLVLIHSWIDVSRDGLLSRIKGRSFVTRTWSVIHNAVAPESLVIYAIGFLVFAVVPYLVLTKTMPSQRAWVEVAVLSCRLLISAALILLGWVTTVGALSISATRPPATLRNAESQ